MIVAGAQELIDDPRTETLTVTMGDVWLAGHCTPGTRVWFRKHFPPHGSRVMDQFMLEGMKAREFLRAGDGLAVAIVRLKLGRSNGQI